MITIFFTRYKKLHPPSTQPTVENLKLEAESFFSGWWSGLVVGSMIGAGALIPILSLLGKL
jgi:hypothetical protein